MLLLFLFYVLIGLDLHVLAFFAALFVVNVSKIIKERKKDKKKGRKIRSDQSTDVQIFF